MNTRQFKRIGIFIFLIILFTVIIQSFSIYENYKDAKRQYLVDVKSALDKSIEEYYAEIAKSDVITFTDLGGVVHNQNMRNTIYPDSGKFNISFFQRFSSSKLSTDLISKLDSNQAINNDSLTISKILIDKGKNKAKFLADQINGIAIFKGKRAADSLDNIKELTDKIVISITRDTLDYDKLIGFLSGQLSSIDLGIDYAINHYKSDSIVGGFNQDNIKNLTLEVQASSTYLPGNEKIEMYFENSTLAILKKGLLPIVASLLVMLFVAAILLYLYRVIKSQKELSEIKNDLITNITHEFKTPITTISTAIEGIQSFNTEKDPDKTRKYLNISGQQLSKLTVMVEKLLETATLDSDKLILQKESTEIDLLVTFLIDRYKEAGNTKHIEVYIPHETQPIYVDAFHFENAISNLIDNAIKYGGENIKITLLQEERLIIMIEDDGGNISKEQKEKVFDKFYRIPKGNIHNIKGFGIGLYYTKNIIEKHNGTIELSVKKGKTVFKITL
ncbi:hypothetical protein GCM10011506_24480 [Marivirga lumbricoides]|uniref:histidine kinase n=2 Tax=Marivirga lumbricoides TaxID=1046115 RepID=A0ABQ1MBN6_9BACT|nr:hypothetical protein GCM10011506_24480 [Marivirga lumbricoides]